MDLIHEYGLGLKGLQLQSKLAEESLNNDLKVNREEMSKAHRYLSSCPGVLKSKIIKNYMAKKGLTSPLNIDIEDFDRISREEFENTESEILLHTIDGVSQKTHLTDGLQDYDGKNLNYLEISSYSLCGVFQKGYGGSETRVNVKNNLEKFIEYNNLDKNNMCPDCLKKIKER